MPSILLRQSNVISDPSATIKGSPLTNPEVDNNFANINIAIGNLNNLSTQAKANLVITINEITSNIGNIANLQTSNTNLVSAINEVRQNVLSSVVIEASRLTDESITSAKLSSNSITSAKISDGNVTTSKIADSNVTTSKISDNAITSAKLADATVSTLKIVDGAVTTAKLSNTGVTAALYGNAIRIPQITIGSDGRITSASNVAISGAGFTNLNAENISSGTLVADRGGTGQNSWVTGQMLYASATNTLAKLQIGTDGQILTVSGGIPTWAANSVGVTSVQLSGGSTGLSFTGGPITSTGTITLSGTLAVANGGTGRTSAAYVDLASNVFGTLPIARGGTGTTSTTFVDLTTNVTGTLPVARGGTGFDSYTAGQILYASGSTSLTRLGIGSEGTFLKVIGGVPAWGTVSGTGITSLGVSNQGGSLGLTISSDVGSPITSTGTLSLSLSSASTFRSNLGLGSMALQDTSILSSYATTSSLSSYALNSSLSSYAPLSGATFSGLVTFNSGVISGPGSGDSYNFTSSYSNYSIYRSGSSIYLSTGYSNNPSFRSYMASSSDYFAALHNSTEVGMGYSAGSAAVGFGQRSGTFWNIYFASNYIDSSTADVRKPGGGAFNSSSDSRLKENIIEYTKGLNAVKTLNPKYFNYNDLTPLGKNTKHKTLVGLIAQDVEQSSLSSLVFDGTDGYKVIDINELTYTFINAIKELSTQIDELKSEINALKST